MRTDLRETFVSNLKMFMEEKGIDQTYIVQTMGVPYSTVSDWCTGKKFPRADNLERLADLLNVLVTDLTKLPGQRGDVSIDVSETERALIDLFREVPHADQDKVVSMIKVALRNPK